MIGILQLVFVKPPFSTGWNPTREPSIWVASTLTNNSSTQESWDDTIDPVLLVAKQIPLVPPLKNMIVKMGNLPQIGVKIKNIWNHHPRIALLQGVSRHDFLRTFSLKATNPIVGLLILQTQPESREVWRELHFPQISTPQGPPKCKKYSETWRCQSFRSYVAIFQHVPMCI